MQPAAGVTGPPREFAPDRAKSDVDDPDLGAAAMEADAEGGGGGAEGGLQPSATFADWPEGEGRREVALLHQPRDGHPGASSSAGPTSQVGAKKRWGALSSLSSRPKRFKGAAAATKREEATAKANRFCREVKEPP